MSVLETVLYFVVPSVGLYVLIAVLVAAPRRGRRRVRYRVGQTWNHPPLWWTADPEGAQLPAPDPQTTTGERGGARDSW